MDDKRMAEIKSNLLLQYKQLGETPTAYQRLLLAIRDVRFLFDALTTAQARIAALEAGRHADRVAGVRKGVSDAKEMVRQYGLAASSEVSLALMASLVRRIEAIDAESAAKEIG